jgi:two-component sensor histidine kinase
VRVAAKQANNLALVFNELTTNSIKYAWPDRQAGQVMVRFDHQEGPDSTGTIVLEFRDDGVGFPDEMLRLEGHHMGWRLIQTIVGRGLGGELCLRNDGGAVTTIRFPEL